MVLSRQDAWSEDEDITLAEIVLRHVREGSTQLSAFQEAGRKLSRTAAACGFRWNGCIRKKYASAIEMARSHKGENKAVEQTESEENKHTSTAALNHTNHADPKTKDDKAADMKEKLQETITFLQTLSRFVEEREAEAEDSLETKKEEMQKENGRLEEELKQVKDDFKRLREDYKALLEVMEKARALSEGALPYLAEENMEESS